MKTAECVEGRHGACDGDTLIEQQSEGGVSYFEQVRCPCHCHVTKIPPPDQNEPTFNLHLD